MKETVMRLANYILGPIRAALLMGRVQTPHRFRTKRQFWAYCGLAIETRDSAEYRIVNGQVERKNKRARCTNYRTRSLILYEDNGFQTSALPRIELERLP